MSTPADRLKDRLKERILREGPISFAHFMEEALYGDGGYYAGSVLPIGESGDFVTGSSLSPFFGRATARLLGALDATLGSPAELLEVGYGTAAHLQAVLGADPGRTAQGWDRVERPLPEGVRRLRDLSQARVTGLVFSYELFDALPVHRLVQRSEALMELGVAFEDAEFRWVDLELSEPELADLVRLPLIDDQVVDLASGWADLYGELASCLDRGLLVTCDYGFATERLYDARVRQHGTLACYRKQTVHRDPFTSIGEQDLTAHVDFGVLVEAGERAGLETVAFTRQAPWLAACGLLDGLAEASGPERFEVLKLMELDGMGEEIRVLVQSRSLDLEALARHLPGFHHLRGSREGLG